MLSLKHQQYSKFFIKNIDNIKLIQLVRLLYISHGYSLVMYDCPFFKDGEIETTSFGSIPIDIYEYYIDFNEFDNHGNFIVPKNHALDYLESNLTKQELEVLNIVLQFYGYIDGWISNVLANDATSPWYKIASHKGFYQIVPNSMTKKYFKNVVKMVKSEYKEEIKITKKEEIKTIKTKRNRDVTLH